MTLLLGATLLFLHAVDIFCTDAAARLAVFEHRTTASATATATVAAASPAAAAASPAAAQATPSPSQTRSPHPSSQVPESPQPSQQSSGWVGRCRLTPD